MNRLSDISFEIPISIRLNNLRIARDIADYCRMKLSTETLTTEDFLEYNDILIDLMIDIEERLNLTELSS